VDAGATVKESIIWGTQGQRSLFSRFGISGTVNVDLTAEYAAKLGAALGAIVPKGSYVAVNRDGHRSSRMLKRALMSGLPGAGVNVWDLSSVAIPVARHFVRNHPNTSAGIHVRLSPFDQRVVDIRFMNEQGMNLNSTMERAIERNFFREDFRRAFLDEIGVIETPYNLLEQYAEDFLRHVDGERIRQANFKVVADYSHGLAGDALANIFTKLRVDVLPLNARMNETKLAMLQDEFRANQQKVAKIVSALGADVGIQLDVGGEKIFLIDEQGNILDDITAAALMTELALYANPGRTVAALITLPGSIETIAGWHNSRVMRISNSMHQMVLTPNEANILLAIDGTGSYIFPDFQPAVDGMMATVRLLEYMAARQMPLSEIVRYLPTVNMAKAAVPCPWEFKGKVMRLLNNTYKHHHVETIDGFKLHLSPEEWVYLTPNPDKPQFELLVEATSPPRVQELLTEYRLLIQRFIEADAN
jgi:mannose-1-phosphate guanylyltransferase/phosphomannomutase